MKKAIFLIVYLWAFQQPTIQAQQRLAILPMSESIVLNLAKQSAAVESICIDEALFPPRQELYNRVLSKGEEEISINGQKYGGGLQGLIDDQIADVTTNGYTKVEISLRKEASFNGQSVTSLSYKQVKPSNIGNQSHNAEGILTDIIFENFDFAGQSRSEVQSKYWRLENILSDLKKDNLLVYDASGKLSDQSLRLTNLYEEFTNTIAEKSSTYKERIGNVNSLSEQLGLNSNGTFEEKLSQIMNICHEIEKAAKDFDQGGQLVGNKYVIAIAKSQYDDAIGLTCEINGHRQYWEGHKFLDNNYHFLTPAEIPDLPAGNVGWIGGRYLLNRKVIMDAIDLPNELLLDLKSRVGAGHEAKIMFSKNIGSFDNVKAMVHSVNIRYQFELSYLGFDDLLDAGRFDIARASLSEISGGFSINIPKIVGTVGRNGNLIIKLRNVLAANYNRARTRLTNLIRLYKGEKNAADFMNDLQLEMQDLQSSRTIEIVAQLSDYYITKIDKKNQANDEEIIAYRDYKAEGYFPGDYLSVGKSRFYK